MRRREQGRRTRLSRYFWWESCPAICCRKYFFRPVRRFPRGSEHQRCHREPRTPIPLRMEAVPSPKPQMHLRRHRKYGLQGSLPGLRPRRGQPRTPIPLRMEAVPSPKPQMHLRRHRKYGLQGSLPGLRPRRGQGDTSSSRDRQISTRACEQELPPLRPARGLEKRKTIRNDLHRSNTLSCSQSGQIRRRGRRVARHPLTVTANRDIPKGRRFTERRGDSPSARISGQFVPICERPPSSQTISSLSMLVPLRVRPEPESGVCRHHQVRQCQGSLGQSPLRRKCAPQSRSNF